MSSIVRAGFSNHGVRSADAFMREMDRERVRVLSSRFCRLREACLDYLEARGLENEALYLTRLREAAKRQG